MVLEKVKKGIAEITKSILQLLGENKAIKKAGENAHIKFKGNLNISLLYFTQHTANYILKFYSLLLNICITNFLLLNSFLCFKINMHFNKLINCSTQKLKTHNFKLKIKLYLYGNFVRPCP